MGDLGRSADRPLTLADFDFELSSELIAQHPAPARGSSRLLVLDRATGGLTHTTIDHLGDWLVAGDRLVLNDTRVFPARLLGVRVPSGGAVECLLLQRLDTLPDSRGREEDWEALVHPGQKLRPGASLAFGSPPRLEAEVLQRRFYGRRVVRLRPTGPWSVMEAIEAIGHIPLPPYIKRPDDPADRERYQTVYAAATGSVAAPTAGLHFTTELLESLATAGVARAVITLHVGYGTFKPVRTERIEAHEVDAEPYVIARDAAEGLQQARAAGRRVVAVGTTSVRALESAWVEGHGQIEAGRGMARLFIHPGFRFHAVDALLTNFHLPRSSLLMLVCAFAGRDRVLAAYREAVEAGYRFYSYGDAMLVV